MTGGVKGVLNRRIGCERRRREGETLCAQTAEAAKRNGEVHNTRRIGMLNGGAIDADLGTVGTGPGRRVDDLVGVAQRFP